MSKEYIPLYWNGIGKHQQEYEILYDELVPHEGEADTERGEILRIVSRWHYDIYNNGGCNRSNFLKELSWLNNHVPDYAKKSTKEFTRAFKYGIPQSNDRMRFIDKYVDWIILYVKTLESLENLKKELK